MLQQVHERLIDSSEAARALLNVKFLSQFLAPASPSDVARLLDMRPNLAHHHARRCQRLGLLFEARRFQGKVFYQLTARQFRLPRGRDRSSGPISEGTLRQLTDAYLAAFERSDTQMDDEHLALSLCSFKTAGAQPVADPIHMESDEARPAFFVHRTFKLTPERYRRLLSRIEALIRNEASEADDPRAGVCTVATLAFDGAAHEGLCDDSLSHSSYFLPVEEPGS